MKYLTLGAFALLFVLAAPIAHADELTCGENEEFVPAVTHEETQCVFVGFPHGDWLNISCTLSGSNLFEFWDKITVEVVDEPAHCEAVEEDENEGGGGGDESEEATPSDEPKKERRSGRTPYFFLKELGYDINDPAVIALAEHVTHFPDLYDQIKDAWALMVFGN